MADTIFRLTASDDTEGSVGATEKIIFNTGSVPDNTGRLIRTSFRMASDLNPHANPDVAGVPIQDALLGVTEVTVAGYFVDHNNTIGPKNLFNWSVDPDVNVNFRRGRFGLSLATMAGLLDVVPTVGLDGIGYMLSEVFCEDVEDPRTEIGFIAKFLRSGKVSPVT